MTPEARKQFNTLMGSLLIVMAMVCFGLTAYMIFTPAKEKPAPTPTVATISTKPCLEGLTALGLTAVATGADIRVVDRNTSALPLERLKTASLGISMCHLYLKSFCMGPACQDSSSLTFVLSPDAK